MPFRASEPPERGLGRRCFNPYSPVSSHLRPTAGVGSCQNGPRGRKDGLFLFPAGLQEMGLGTWNLGRSKEMIREAESSRPHVDMIGRQTREMYD